MNNDSGKKQLNIDNLKDVIREWKFAWMDIKGTDECDRENYQRRAFGIDANMKHDLAKRIESAFTPCANCERLEGEKKEYRHEAYVRQKINKQLDAENEKLKAQLAMCKEALKYYRGDDDDETSWMEPDQHLMYWTLWHDGDCVGGKVAAECLAKLEESEK